MSTCSTTNLTKREILNIHLAMRLAVDGARYSKCVRSKVGQETMRGH